MQRDMKEALELVGKGLTNKLCDFFLEGEVHLRGADIAARAAAAGAVPEIDVKKHKIHCVVEMKKMVYCNRDCCTRSLTSASDSANPR